MMSTHLNSFAARLLLPLTVAAGVLSGCGGGGNDNGDGARAFVQAMASGQATADTEILGADQRSHALAVVRIPSATPITIDQLFDWAETQYKDWFPHARLEVKIADFQYLGVHYSIRGYPGGRYVGVRLSDNAVYALGDFTGNQLLSVGFVVDFTCQVSPSSCTTAPPVNPSLNQCADPANGTLPTGYKTHLVYTLNAAGVSSEQTTDATVDGPATFQGQSAVQVSSVTTFTIATSISGGFNSTTSSTATTKNYVQSAGNGLVKALGSAIQSTSTTTITGGPVSLPPQVTNSASTIVFNPAYIDYQLTLAVGQSRTDSSTSTTTITLPVAQPPVTATSTVTTTLEAIEQVTVPAGTYSACRYRSNSGTADSTATLTWLAVGKGILLKSQAASSSTATLLLKSGTVNGNPI